MLLCHPKIFKLRRRQTAVINSLRNLPAEPLIVNQISGPSFQAHNRTDIFATPQILFASPPFPFTTPYQICRPISILGRRENVHFFESPHLYSACVFVIAFPPACFFYTSLHFLPLLPLLRLLLRFLPVLLAAC